MKRCYQCKDEKDATAFPVVNGVESRTCDECLPPDDSVEDFSYPRQCSVCGLMKEGEEFKTSWGPRETQVKAATSCTPCRTDLTPTERVQLSKKTTAKNTVNFQNILSKKW